MRKTRSKSGVSSATPHRDGFTLRILVVAMVLLAAGAAAGWYVLANSSFSVSPDGSGPMFHTVERGEYVHDITERGNVESASNVEIKCQVQSQGSQGTMILWVIEEGKHVEPGDVLVTLDSSKLEDSEVKQQITCNSSKAAVIQAQSNYDTAKIAKDEYIEGTFEERKLDLLNKIFSAEEALRLAEQNRDYSRKLLAKGYVTELELEASNFGMEKARKDLEAREIELQGLERYTYKKMLKDLEAGIETSKARLESEEHSHKLDNEKLKLIKEQIEACTVKAPEPGQVVYANITNMRGGSETIIEEGTYVRERQTIIRLPDPSRMQVKAKINEARVALVEQGMVASVELDAFPDQVLFGEVEKVNEYPIPTSFFSGNVKEYETIIRITDEKLPEGLRPGLTAEIKIRVERESNVLQVPVQAVFEHGGKYYCVLAGKKEGQWEAREVTIGSTNAKFVVIKDGLTEGEEVVMGAFTYREKLDLPELEPEQQEAQGKAGAQDPGDKPEPAKPGGGGRPGAERSGQAGPGGARPDPSQFFTSSDADGDGKLQKSELPTGMQGRFADLDKNGDGAVDKSEFSAAMATMRAKGGGGRARGGGARGGQNARPGGPGGGQRSGDGQRSGRPAGAASGGGS